MKGRLPLDNSRRPSWSPWYADTDGHSFHRQPLGPSYEADQAVREPADKGALDELKKALHEYEVALVGLAAIDRKSAPEFSRDDLE